MREVAVGIWDTLAKDSYTTEAIEKTKDYMRLLGRIE